jgi:PTS system mannose-specific IIB component
VDDEIAESDSLSFVYKNAAPEHIKVHIFTEEKALAKLPEAVASNKAYFFLVRNPLVLERLSRAGLDFSFLKELVMGPTLNAPDTHNLTGAWNYTPEEFKAIDYLAGLGIEIRFQMIPEQPKYYWKDIRKNCERFLKD